MIVSCEIVASVSAWDFIARLLALLRRWSGLVILVLRILALKSLPSPTVFVSCVMVASEGARVFVAWILALLRRWTGLGLGLFRGAFLACLNAFRLLLCGLPHSQPPTRGKLIRHKRAPTSTETETWQTHLVTKLYRVVLRLT